MKTIPFLAALISLMASGCATTSSLNQPVHTGVPLVMSGTRLNIAGLRQGDFAKERFGVTPPAYPLIDLPFSIALDTYALGYTVPMALIRRY